MKTRLLTEAIVLWLLSIRAAICFIRLIHRIVSKAAVEKMINSPRASVALSEKRDNYFFLWHIRPPPLSAV
jgi:hypothetical protein